MSLTKQLATILPLGLIVLGLLSYNFMSAQWTGPTGTAPTNNIAAPINVSSTTQSKAGSFNAYILSAATSTWSPRYCDELGGNCWDPATGAPGGGGITLFGGAGVTLSPTTITSTGTININQTYTQRRITGTCPAGQAVTVINVDGTVGCSTAGGIGVNQTWQNFTGSRSTNVWYQNTTNSPISVYVWVSPGDGFLYANTVGSDSGAVQIAGPDNSSGTRDNLFGIIPAGHWYKQTGRTPTGWSELR